MIDKSDWEVFEAADGNLSIRQKKFDASSDIRLFLRDLDQHWQDIAVTEMEGITNTSEAMTNKQYDDSIKLLERLIEIREGIRKKYADPWHRIDDLPGFPTKRP